MSDKPTPVIEVQRLGKQFNVPHQKGALIFALLPQLLRRQRIEEFWALRELSLSIAPGNSLGILGTNGAGKTTLLSLLAGILTPTEGTLTVNGNISCLLGLGSGFEPELTGEENLLLNGLILGMPMSEIREKYQSMVSFAELDGFLDTPIKIYSSGMQARLGFAIAVHKNFDILMVDEILSVGDLAFQEKCRRKFLEFRAEQKTLIIATQSPDMLQGLCDEVLVLDRGHLAYLGHPEAASTFYSEFILRRRRRSASADSRLLSPDLKLAWTERRHLCGPSRIKAWWGERKGSRNLCEIISVQLSGSPGKEPGTVSVGKPLEVQVRFRCHNALKDPHFGIALFREDQTYVFGPNTRYDRYQIETLAPGNGEFCLRFPRLALAPGRYRVSVAIWDEDEQNPYDYLCATIPLTVAGSAKGSGLCLLTCKPRRRSALPLLEMKEAIVTTGDFLSLPLPKRPQSGDVPIHVRIIRQWDRLVCFEAEVKPGFISLEFPKFDLLPEEYGLEVDDKLHTRIFVKSGRRDHGVLWMPHRWTLKLPKGSIVRRLRKQ
ncbi:MAG: ABC transporter ATP-binding protein [Candidatus Omnitrophica bacterium]|nr:ABC transporter ATP-binding protein [Candidatus Omnitrophota bacterium]